MEQIKETAFDWTSRDARGYWTSNEQSVIRKITDYANKRPDEVTILKTPEVNGGYIMALVPKKWMNVKPPRKRELTDEQREVVTKRMAEIRKN